THTYPLSLHDALPISWPPGSAAVNSPNPTRTPWPTATSWPTTPSRPRDTPPTRCRTGRVDRRAAALTTICIGPVATGGGSVRGRTVTSAVPVGGTSSIRPPTPRAWPQGTVLGRH